jgi:hypothetical protein
LYQPQQWTGGGAFQFKSKENSNYCMDLSNGDTTNGNFVEIWNCNNEDMTNGNPAGLRVSEGTGIGGGGGTGPDNYECLNDGSCAKSTNPRFAPYTDLNSCNAECGKKWGCKKETPSYGREVQYCMPDSSGTIGDANTCEGSCSE